MALNRISIIIPVLTEESCLGETLQALRRLGGELEIIVVDGGSADRTREIVQRCGVTLLSAKAGRGNQMNVGASAAIGDVLWFLHADTHPPHDALQQISTAFNQPSSVGGCFDVVFDGESRAGKFLTVIYRGLRRIGLCYGDSAIFVRTSAFHALGGFKKFPIFEDLDFVNRAKREGRFMHLRSKVITSSRRFENRSFALTFARWSFLQVLYWLGIPPQKLGRMYAPIRTNRHESS